MKPFKAMTKTGEKWFWADGNSLVEVPASDVPRIVAKLEAAKLATAAAAERAAERRAADEQDLEDRYRTDPFYDYRFENIWYRSLDSLTD